MAVDRDAIFEALKARLRDRLPEVVTLDDRIRAWSDVSPTEQPAIFVTKAAEHYVNERGLPPKVSLLARLIVYAHQSTRPDVSAQRQANMLMQKIEAALERTTEEGQDGTTPWATTLGGLVSHAWIDGEVQTDEGALGDQTVQVVPVEMLTTQ